MNGLVSGADELIIRLMQMDWHDRDARNRRRLTQNRHPLLLKAQSVAGFER
jgi:hypothetical protein